MNCLSSSSASPIARAACAALLTLLACSGARPAEAGGWKYTITPYAWATDVGMDVRLSGRQVVDQTIPVSDLLEDIDTMVQLRLEAQHGRFGAMVDVFDATLSDRLGAEELAKVPGLTSLDSKIGMTILDVAGLFDPKGDRQGLSFVYGIRLLNERGDVDATLSPAPGVSVAQGYDGGETYVDGLLGARFDRTFAKRWTYRMEADASTGGTDYTWSVGPSLTYAFGETGRHGLVAGYRHMQVNFKDDAELDTRMSLSGLRLGYRLAF